MDIVPFIGRKISSDEAEQEAAVNNNFLQLLQENRQVNVEALEERAERRHRIVLDHIYSEASARMRHREITADANHRLRVVIR